jgi:hypothetical protein
VSGFSGCDLRRTGCTIQSRGAALFQNFFEKRHELQPVEILKMLIATIKILLKEVKVYFFGIRKKFCTF